MSYCRTSAPSLGAFRPFVAVLIFGVVFGHSHAAGQEPGDDAVLRQRILAFWDAMQKEEYATATQFMHSDSREVFEHRLPKSRVNSYRIDKIECNAERAECTVRMLVKKPVAILNAQEVEWPLTNTWVLDQGTWYFRLPSESSKNPILEMFRAQATVESVQQPDVAAVKPKPSPDGTETLSQRYFISDPANPQQVHRGEKAVFKFNLRNRTSETLRIVSVHSDCHCTNVKASQPEIPPGRTGSIEATLDTFGLPLGPIEKKIQVVFADLPHPVIALLRVSNEANFEVQPSSLDFGTVNAGRPVEGTLRITNRSGRQVRILHVPSSTRLVLSPAEGVLAPGEELAVTVRYSPESDGDFVASLMLKTDLSAEPLITVLVAGKAVR